MVMKRNGVEEAAALLMKHRRALSAYVRAIVRDPHVTEDVLQEVSVVVIRRCRELGEFRDFWRLAREIARRQSLAALRAQSQSDLALSPEALDALDRGFEGITSGVEDRERALHTCVGLLPESWQCIVRMRYWRSCAVGEVARRLKRSENSVSVALNRIHKRLADCVRRTLNEEAAT